jgi:IS30 family transposase
VRRLLTLADREEISRGLAEGLLLKGIAERIGCDPSVLSREGGRHGGRRAYRARAADVSAARGRQRPPDRKIDRVPGLREQVAGLFKIGWSPASIAGRLPIEHPDCEGWRVSHEAIYRWVYAQPVGELRTALIELRPAAPVVAGRARSVGPRRGSRTRAGSRNVRPTPRTAGCPGIVKATW